MPASMSRPTPIVVRLLICCGLAGATVLVHARQQPVFRSSADVVEVDAVVTDSSGAVVRGLTRSDFQVTEDGQPQAISLFSFIDIPLPPSTGQAVVAAPAAQPDTASNTNLRESRLYVIVLDAFHVDPTRSTTVRKLARQFIENDLGPDDVAAVIHIGGKVSANQAFTSNKQLLIDSVNQFIGGKPKPATITTFDMMNRGLASLYASEDFEEGARASEAKISLESAKRLCQALGPVTGRRKTLVVFSEGIDLDTSDLIGEDARPAAGGQGLMHQPSRDAQDVLEGEKDMLLAAARANVTIDTVDPRGTSIGSSDWMMYSGSDSPTLGVASETARGQGTLRTFSEETGGVAVVNTMELSAGFAHIVQANSSYYVLGYVPSNTKRDGTIRHLSVKVNRPGLDVSARKAYYAPSDAAPAPAAAPERAPARSTGGMSPTLRDLLTRPLPTSGLGLTITAAPVKRQGNRVLVALVVNLDGRSLPFTESGGQLSNDIDIGFLAADATGKVQAANHSGGTLKLPATARAAVADGLRYLAEFAVPPGAYQVRVAASESAGGTSGSAMLDLDVPGFDQALTMGAILLTDTGAANVPTTGSDPVLRSILPTPPTALREFPTAGTLTAFVNLVEGASLKGPVTVVTRVVDQAGGVAFRQAVTPNARDLSGAKNGYANLSIIPLSTFKPGRYTLTIDASTPGEKSVSRALVFDVR
jgi:VWFA-related protein